MALDRFFNEENIVKREQSNSSKEAEQVVDKIKEPKKSKDEKPSIEKQQEKSKQQEYQEVINKIEEEYKQTTSEELKIPKQEQEKSYQQSQIPVYNVSRDFNTGQVIMETKKNREEKQEVPKQIISLTLNSPKKQQVQVMLDKTQQEILRLSVEIEVNLALIKIEADGKRQDFIETTITALKKDLDYQYKRQLILEKMLQEE